MTGIFFAKINDINSGLTNQIFSLVIAISFAIQRSNHTVIIGQFQPDYFDTSRTIDCDEIFNLEETNKNLKENNIYVTLICKSKFNYKLNSVLYGSGDNIIDITEQSPSVILTGSYNSIKGDPSHGVVKQLCVNYLMNEKEYTDIYDETYTGNIHVKNVNYESTRGFVDKESQYTFDLILKCIQYKTCIDSFSFIPLLNSDEKNNVIHLRLEDDSIQHWSRQNKMNPSHFKTQLEEKYIQTILHHIDKTVKTIVVGSKQNKVIDFLRENNYNYIFYNLNLNGREINAIYDLIQASQCNETFISNFNYKDFNGSSFSYYISVISKPKKIVAIDIDCIHSPYILYN